VSESLETLKTELERYGEASDAATNERARAMMNNNRMGTDKTIKLDPAKSVLKYRVGEEIKLKEADFMLLSSAFFAEIASKYL